jgi:hypothetical protein
VGLPALLLLTTSLVLFLSLFRREQKEIFLRYRLETCALEALAERRKLLHRLVAFNKSMIPLQSIVYAGRAGRAIPGLGLVSHAAAEAARATLMSIARARDLIIQSAPLLEQSKRICRPSRHSRELAFCSFQPFRRSMLSPNPVAFPDVPPTFSLANGPVKTKFSCRARSEREELILVGNPKLLQANFKHSYETRL